MATFDICILIYEFSAMAVGGIVLGFGWFVPQDQHHEVISAAFAQVDDVQIWAVD